MTETRKLAAILAADVVGYSRLAGAEEDRTLARLRGDPSIFETGDRPVRMTIQDRNALGCDQFCNLPQFRARAERGSVPPHSF